MEGVSDDPEFDNGRSLVKSYTPLPFQIHETVKNIQYPINRLCKSPLPVLSWADHEEVWKTMLQKDTIYSKDENILCNHPELKARMRAILLNWLMEVCETFKLNRDTFYLSVDILDRYLSQSHNIPKAQLQCTGITALFIASKIEEIYPPKLMDFAYVTDESSSESDILTQELMILKILNWDLCPMTWNSWLTVFMQLLQKDTSDDFLFPKFSGHEFCKVGQLLDLAILDIGSLKYCNNVVVSVAIHYMISNDLALSLSGLRQQDIAMCMDWMKPFFLVFAKSDLILSRTDEYNIQRSSASIGMLDAALAI